MTTRKNILGTLAAAFLPVMLFSFGVLMSAFQMLGSPDPLKNALDKSGLYEVAIAEAVQNAGRQTTGDTGQPIIDNPRVQEVVEQAIPPDFVREKSNTVIDSVYSWLHGDTDRLQFNLDLTEAQTKLADGMAGYTEQHLASLPVCTAADTTAATDPVNATCVPPDFDRAAAAQTVREEILNNGGIISDNGTLSAGDLKGSDGTPLDQQLRAVPAVYEQVKWGTIITGVLAILCLILVLLFGGGYRVGVKRLGVIALSTGAVSALLAWGSGFALRKLLAAIDSANGSAFQEAGIKAIQLITQEVRDWWLAYGLILAGAGIAAISAAWLIGRNQRSGGEEVDASELPSKPQNESIPVVSHPGNTPVPEAGVPKPPRPRNLVGKQ
jgi:hypothetical protein